MDDDNDPVVVPVTDEHTGLLPASDAGDADRTDGSFSARVQRCKHACLHSPPLLYARANDTEIRAAGVLFAVSYYLDAFFDVRLLLAFLVNRQYVYFRLNAIGVLLGASCEAMANATPLFGPILLVRQQFRLRKPLPPEPRAKDFNECEERLQQLEEFGEQVFSRGLLDSSIKGAVSLLVQGFALALETGYGGTERRWLAVSVLQGTVSMAWAFCGLDARGRVLRSVDVQSCDGQREVPLVCGTLPLAKRTGILLLRWIEIVMRLGPMILALVSFELTMESVWDVRLATGAMLVAMATVDLLLCLWKGPAGAWMRTPQSFVAIESPVVFPSHLPAMGPPAAALRVVRILETAALLTWCFWLYGWSLEALWRDFGADPARACLVLASLACAASGLVVCLVLDFLAPVSSPEQARRAWGDMLGRGVDGEENAFPEVPRAERSMFVAYGLLPPPRANTAPRAASRPLGEQAHAGKTLDCSGMTEETVEAKAKQVEAAADASRIDAGLSKLGRAGWERFARALQGRPRVALEVLSLFDCGLDDEAVAALAPGLRGLDSLKELDLAYAMQGATAGGWRALGDALRGRVGDSLRELRLNGCGLDDAKLEALALKMPRLKTLELRTNSLTSRGLASLRLQGLPSLRRLCRDPPEDEKRMWLCQSEVLAVERAQLLGLRPALPWLSFAAVETLRIEGGPSMTVKDLATFAWVLRGRASFTLTHLALAGFLDDTGVEALAPGLEALAALETLEVTLWGVGPAGWALLRFALRQKAGVRLRELDVSNNGLSGESQRHLLRLEEEVPELVIRGLHNESESCTSGLSLPPRLG